MEKTYTRINWVNESVSQTTPLGATNLNTMDYALNEVDNRVITLDTTKALESEVLPMLADVAYNATTGVFTFTRKNGTTVTADINIEKIPVSFSMDENGVITMTTTDGSTYTADVGSLIKTYTFSDSSTVDFTTTIDASGNKTVTASVIDGSITGDKLNPDYLAEINGKVQTATSAAESAGTSAGTASTKATESTSSATESKSWAVGGTNTREGEDTNNAKYWCEQAAATSGIGTGNLILSQNGVEKGIFNANSYADIEIDLDGKPEGYDELVEDVEALDSTVKNKGDALSIREVGAQKQLCLMSGDRRLSFVPMPDGGAKAYTTSEWEALDHSTISDGTQIVITDDYDSNICSTIAECEASESVDDVAGASALKELASKKPSYTLLATSTSTSTSFETKTVSDLSQFNYIMICINVPNANLLNPVMLPYDLFKTFNTSTHAFVGRYSDVTYRACWYSDTSIGMNTSNVTYPCAIFGIK